MDDRNSDISTTEARAGTTKPKTRYILFWSLGLVVLAFVMLLWLT